LLAQWSGWGACADVFDGSNETFRELRNELHSLLTDSDYTLAERSVLNAHYTPPELANSMWHALEELGMPQDALVVEPGCGSGNFLGTRPSEVVAIGIEQDPMTARIARALYDEDDVTILNESFAHTNLPSYDVAVGNVPFGNFEIYDASDRSLSGQSIHNYFITKSLKHVREDGIVMVLTSRYTMDATSTETRDLIRSLGGRFLGAVRLPGKTMSRVAGTTVITDILILQRSSLPDVADWTSVTQIGTKADGVEPIMANEYFLAHPEAVVGELGITSGPFGDTVGVEYTGSYDDLFRDIDATLHRVVQDALDHTVVMDAKGLGPEYQMRLHRALDEGPTMPRGSIVKVAPHEYRYFGLGADAIHKVTKKDEAELDALLTLRDLQSQILTFESLGHDEDVVGPLRSQFGDLYDDYVAQYGCLNRQYIKENTSAKANIDSSATNADADELEEQREFADVIEYVRPTQGGFMRDPLAARLFSVEIYDLQNDKGEKGAFFNTRVTAQVETPVVTTPLDAIAYSMAYAHAIDPVLVGNLLEIRTSEAQALIEETAYFNPASNAWEHPAVYLSGNIYEKLDALPADDPAFERNRDALEALIPERIPASMINVSPGATWIPLAEYQSFINEVITPAHPDSLTVGYDAILGQWSIDGNMYEYDPRAFGDLRQWNSVTLLRAVLNGTSPTVYKNDGDKRVVNVDATASVQEALETLRSDFASWIWVNPDRTERLEEAYNRHFNAIVQRSYDDFTVTPVGLSATFHPHSHQLSAVARIINEPATLLAHVVGAGKTASMVMGAMELRRLRISNKVAVVVPNHMLDQFTRESYQLYPNARILSIGSKDVSNAKNMTERRRLVLEQAASNDWDLIILTYRAFQAIPVSAEVEERFIRQRIDELEASKLAEDAANGTSRSQSLMAKERAKRMESLKARLEKVTSKYDPQTPSFDRLGFDAVFIDEAHLFKNTLLLSNNRTFSRTGSQRATDLQMKIDYLRTQHERARIVFATATPLSNSISEAYTMWHYLRPDLLEYAGIEHFDAWLAQFARTKDELEMRPDGSGFRVVSRYSQFVNLPELMNAMGTFMDAKTQDELQLIVPSIRGGQSQIVAIPPSPALQIGMRWLAHRTNEVGRQRPGPGADNLLSILGDGRSMTLSMHMMLNRPQFGEWCRDRYPGVPYDEPDESNKIAVVAANIALVYQRHKDDRFSPTDTPGALQLVFMDYGTPGGDKHYVAYDDLRNRLIEHGIPGSQIRFMQEAKTDSEKAQLFQQARSGAISVLIGSTESMGVGTNVQTRAVAIHEVTCPWRPADIAQRMGRIVRQGNRYSEIESYRYVVEGSLDAYSWQTVERKERFIIELMRHALSHREMEDIGEEVLSYAQTKAVASGNRLLMELAGVDDELRRLSQKHKAYQFKKNDLERQLRQVNSYHTSHTRDLQLNTDMYTSYSDTIEHPTECFLGFKPSRFCSWTPDAPIHSVEQVHEFLDHIGRMLIDPNEVATIRQLNTVSLGVTIEPSQRCESHRNCGITLHLGTASIRPGYTLMGQYDFTQNAFSIYIPVKDIHAFEKHIKKQQQLASGLLPTESDAPTPDVETVDALVPSDSVIDAENILEAASEALTLDSSMKSALIQTIDHPLADLYASMVASLHQFSQQTAFLEQRLREDTKLQSSLEDQLNKLSFDPDIEQRIRELTDRKIALNKELAAQSQGDATQTAEVPHDVVFTKFDADEDEVTEFATPVTSMDISNAPEPSSTVDDGTLLPFR
jgi:N12 class adenine-specific DNA methylase